MVTVFQKFCSRWKNGCGAYECSKATNVVLCRGKIPCEVLFTGESPGESENLLGIPFIGPAGRLLDHIIERSVPRDKYACAKCGQDVTKLMEDNRYSGCVKCHSFNTTYKPGIRYAITNLVGCIPRDDASGGKISSPSIEQVRQCSKRLQEFVEICDPKLIVCVGSEARDWLDPKYVYTVANFHKKIPTVHIVHPSAMLRANIAQRSLAVQQAVVVISNAIYDIIGVS